ncbi:hypothetical protein Lser_V15G37195 [Lactuca serriola]
MSSTMHFSLLFFICCCPCFSLPGLSLPKGPSLPSLPKVVPLPKGSSPLKGPSPPKGPSDPNSLYKSFLECLPTSSPQPDKTFSSVVYSSAANSSAYTKVLMDHIKNFRYNATSTPKPAIIITPNKETHVQAAVICAKKLNIQIRIRSGGHDYEGVSYTSSEKTQFMIIDMFNLRAVDVNVAKETAVVQAGAQLGDLYYRIWEKSKVHGFPAGACPTVGVGGHISGGGYGTMIRKYGLTVDHVIDAKIVDVKGRLLDRKGMGEDLFWAIRGGGGSSFGVILSFTVKLVPVPKVTTVFKVTKKVEEKAVDIVFKWQSVMSTIDPDLFIRVLLQPTKEKNKSTAQATFMALFLGDSTRLLGLMGKSFPELGLKKQDCFEVSWIQSTLFWSNFDYNKTKLDILIDRHTDVVKFLKRKSDYVQTPIPTTGVTSMFNKLGELGKIGLVFNPYGGKMNEIPANATPFPHRAGNLFKVQYSLSWINGDPKETENNMNQSRVMYDFMTNYVAKNPRSAFVNYRDLDIGVNKGDGLTSAKVYGEKYFKNNFDRLVKVKTAVDPENFFRNEQSIPIQPGKKGKHNDVSTIDDYIYNGKDQSIPILPRKHTDVSMTDDYKYNRNKRLPEKHTDVSKTGDYIYNGNEQSIPTLPGKHTDVSKTDDYIYNGNEQSTPTFPGKHTHVSKTGDYIYNGNEQSIPTLPGKHTDVSKTDDYIYNGNEQSTPTFPGKHTHVSKTGDYIYNGNIQSIPTLPEKHTDVSKTDDYIYNGKKQSIPTLPGKHTDVSMTKDYIYNINEHRK